MTEPQSPSRVALQQLQTETSSHFPCQSREAFGHDPTSVPATPDGGVDAGPGHDIDYQSYMPSFPEDSLPQPYPQPSDLPQPLETPTLEHRPDLDLALSLPPGNASLYINCTEDSA
ncbi:hypothetical protein P3342_002374 [Pyrenophora teres f. teres]|nr:hypothetical protein P3342_002374 [Pyrenophora teres f. teres]